MFLGHGLEWLGGCVGPREQLVDGAVEVSIDDLCQHVSEVSIRFDAAEFAVLNQCGDDGPVVTPAVGTREERILTIESHFPFILPMSGRSWKSITNGIHISAVKLVSAE